MTTRPTIIDGDNDGMLSNLGTYDTSEPTPLQRPVRQKQKEKTKSINYSG